MKFWRPCRKRSPFGFAFRRLSDRLKPELQANHLGEVVRLPSKRWMKFWSWSRPEHCRIVATNTTSPAETSDPESSAHIRSRRFKWQTVARRARKSSLTFTGRRAGACRLSVSGESSTRGCWEKMRRRVAGAGLYRHGLRRTGLAREIVAGLSERLAAAASRNDAAVVAGQDAFAGVSPVILLFRFLA